MKRIYLTCFTFAIGFLSKAQDLASTMTVSPGTSVSIASSTTLYASELNLKSTSNSFASLLLKGDVGPSTIVNYDRYVNMVGSSGVPGGNDLISLPLKLEGDVTFTDFLNYSSDDELTLNSDDLVNSPSVTTLYAFGPYNNETETYTNYDSSTDGDVLLERAVGYRAATDNGQTLRFTGAVSKTSETVDITTNTTTDNYWNSVGNPYPIYLDSQAFLAQNASVLHPVTTAIYGYNSGVNSPGTNIGLFTIINYVSNTDLNIAPGQGFLLANKPDDVSNTITFTTGMQTFTGTDDFIMGRNSNNSQKLRLRADQGSNNFVTEFYFNSNSTLGLDPGYDAGVYNGTSSNFMIYSQLVEDNTGYNMAIQSLGLADLNDVIIPLGLKTLQGQQVTFSIEESTLPEGTLVYLEDNQTNTFTSLNTGDYTFTSDAVINGTGRFFLRIGNSTLSTINQESKNLQLFATEKTLFINGLLLDNTKISVYDIQGRLVLTSYLEEGSESNKIDTNSLNPGIYVVKLNNEQQQQTKKVIIK